MNKRLFITKLKSKKKNIQIKNRAKHKHIEKENKKYSIIILRIAMNMVHI